MKHYLNVNYICNERCVFCASDLTNHLRGPGVSRELTIEQIRAWIAERRPRRGDEVLLAGGEPTLHRQLFDIVREFAAHCRNVTLFTNGVKLADASYASDAIAAGVTGFEIALFGATPQTHEAITRRPGSFEQTIAALNNLVNGRRGHEVSVVVRLLVARHCYHELPQIVRAVHRQAPGIDKFSINRLILSDNARGTEAMVAWPEASRAINEAAALVRELNYDLGFWPVPLCVFRGDNAAFIDGEVKRQLRRRRTVRSNLRYLDPLVASGTPLRRTTRKSSCAARALPEVCENCRYRSMCGGIEGWYYERFGAVGLGLECGEGA